MERIRKAFEQVAAVSPLVHCITNYVTANDCANILLACGGSPIMADDATEAAQITAQCAALVLNIGTLNARTVEAMLLAGKQANELGRPVLLDPVGAGASGLRTQTALRLLEELRFTAIRGNASEIRTLAQGCGSTSGVDAGAADAVTAQNLAETAKWVGAFARRTGAVVTLTGAIDLITDGSHAYAVYNGHPRLAKITGSGCMLSAMSAAFLAANPDAPLEAMAAAAAVMGLCGERAQARVEQEGGGTASLRVRLIDEVSLLDGETLAGGVKIEKI